MSDQPDDATDGMIPSHGTVVRAKNGDVIRYDPTGLTLRLSDRVVADIALRLDLGPQAPAPEAAIDPDALHGIDAWGLTRVGDWLHFTARLPGAQGTRGFRRHIEGGTILGDGPGPVMGLFGLGGPRAALATPGAPAFPHHVLAPEDDIGAVGHAAIDAATEIDRLEPLRERTHEALTADTLLTWQMAGFRPLPLFVARVETDPSPSATDLAGGPAVTNLLTAARNLKAAAARLGKPAKIQAICLDYGWEHVTGDATAYRDGMLALMTRLSDELWRLGFDKPLFVMRMEAGLDAPNADAILSGQWELSWNHGDHDLIVSAPATMFALDRFDRPTEDARQEMAEMTAASLSAGKAWMCPIPMLAERVAGVPNTLRVTTRALGPLSLDQGAPDTGFALTHKGKALKVKSAEIDPADPASVLVTTASLPTSGDDLMLTYGVEGPGALHDDWSLQSATGRTLRRYALPARLAVHGGPAA